MRLGQLSRKLNIPPSEIGFIIAEEFKVDIGAHPNIKIDDGHAKYLIEKFQKSESKNIETNSELTVFPTEEVIQNENPKTENSDNKENETSKESEIEEIETIRVKAAKLDGLKVVDKIELPEPPPPEMVEIDGVMYDKAELKKQRIAERKGREAQRRKEAAKRAADRKSGANKSKNKNKKELSFAEKRKLEEEQDRDQKKQEERRKRYSKKKHYISKHKIHKPASIKLEEKEETEIEIEEIAIETHPEPKTLLGKFWRWLNTY